jgi:hypothetical protein
MAVLIRVWNLMGEAFDPDPELIAALDRGEPIWLKMADFDAAEGRGYIRFTDHQEDAQRFAGVGEAFEMWRKQSTRRPLRPDGKPNRPLTAFSITFDTVADDPVGLPEAPPAAR